MYNHRSPWVVSANDFQKQTNNLVSFDFLKKYFLSSVGKESACNAGDPGSIPGSGRSGGEGIDYPLQYSGGSAGKEPTCNAGDLSSIPGLGRSPGEKRLPTPVFWPGESHGLCMGPQRVGHD